MSRLNRYAALRSQLKTGDLVLFSGKAWSSDSIKLVTLSRWSHVAMVWVMAEYDFVCLWEANTLTDVRNLDAPRARPGVMLVPLSERLHTYDGAVALRQLEGTALRKKDLMALTGLRKKLARRPYEKSTLEMMTAAYDGPYGEQRENLSSLFCSELVAEAYQALGLLRGGKKDKASNEYVPADFSKDHERLSWRRGQLGPEILLKL